MSCARGLRLSRKADSPEAEPGQGTNIHSAMDAATGQNASAAGGACFSVMTMTSCSAASGRVRLRRREVGDALGTCAARSLGFASLHSCHSSSQNRPTPTRIVDDHHGRPPGSVEEAEGDDQSVPDGEAEDVPPRDRAMRANGAARPHEQGEQQLPEEHAGDREEEHPEERPAPGVEDGPADEAARAAAGTPPG